MASIPQQILDDIPLARSMAFEILSLSGLESTARLPLPPNKNHLDTLFGGSLYAASALCSYSCLLQALADKKIENTRLVIVDGQIKYLHPGRGDAEVRAWTQAADLARFFSQLEKQKKARISYEATLSHGGKILSRFKGLYQVNLSGPA